LKQAKQNKISKLKLLSILLYA